jgi:flagellar protein FliO/FliZ
MNSLFGVDLPTPVNFVIAFVVVLLLIGAATWLVRRFGATRLDAAARSRQPRLAVVDAAAVDGRRKLVIIRRDNVEHLLMIGGPSDVVVETNIVRAAVGVRDALPGRNGPALPDPAPWPEPAPAPPLAARAERAMPRAAVEDTWQAPEPIAPPVSPMPPVRAVRPADTLASLAHELGRAAPDAQAPPRPVAVEAPPPPQAAAYAAPQPAAPQAAAPDQSLAEMAQRLEAALRRPKPVAAAAAPTAEVKPAPRAPRVVVAAPKGGAQPAAQPQNNLEQEMASLLNKPGKT